METQIKLVLGTIAFFLSASLYLPLVRGILKGNKQNFSTWFLWVVLDIIAYVSTRNEALRKGLVPNTGTLLCYVIGGSMVVAALVYTRQFTMNKFDLFIAFLTVLCMIVWRFSGDWWAIVMSSVAVFIAGLPQVRDFCYAPDKQSAKIYSVYLLVNVLSCAAGAAWTVQDRLYYFLCAVLMLLDVITAGRRQPILVKRAVTNTLVAA